MQLVLQGIGRLLLEAIYKVADDQNLMDVIVSCAHSSL